jgi:hypothetical protein
VASEGAAGVALTRNTWWWPVGFGDLARVALKAEAAWVGRRGRGRRSMGHSTRTTACIPLD